MGGVFNRRFLRLGYPVYPMTRQMGLSSEPKKPADPKLALKKLNIRTSKIAGWGSGGKQSELWVQQQRARSIAGDIIKTQQALTHSMLNSEALSTAMVTAFKLIQHIGASAAVRRIDSTEHVFMQTA